MWYGLSCLRAGTWRRLAGLMICIGCVAWPARAPGAQEGIDLEASIRAGEFGPALEAARAIQDDALRDRWLGRIAVRQAELGAREASYRTFLDMRGDLARREAIGSLAGVMAGGGASGGARGGAAMADFDSLIELIQSTIAPNDWEEAGGAGVIQPFPTGVYVDASGLMKRLGPANDSTLLEAARRAAATDSGNRSARHPSGLRKVSLVRLERQLQLDQALGRRPDEAMCVLAGIYRIQYLFVYPEAGDLVLAGPAGDWHTDAEGRVVNVATGAPTLQLDDLVVVLRNALTQHSQFGCTIEPRQEGLAAARRFQESWQGRSVSPSQRRKWLDQLQAALGTQRIRVWGIDARTRTARVLVEADYRMKLIGMGLEPGTLGVTSYLDAVKRAGGEPAAMSVLRWWFTLNYEGIRTTAARDAFQLDGPGVQVLSENEKVSATGERIHTGASDELTSGFARSFTRHFDALAAKYPIYAELRNVFDMALVAGLMVSHDLPGQVDWHLTYWSDPDGYPVALGPAPQQVESVINHVMINRSRFVAGVSGGVSVDAGPLVGADAVRVDDYGLLEADRASAAPPPSTLPPDAWWWD